MVDLPDTIVSGDENQLIYLVSPSYSGSGWTFSDERVLNSTYRTVEWYYLRNGGCGGFKLILKEEFTEADDALQEGWEIQLRIQLEDESSFTTWYRGIIKSVERRTVGSEIVTEIKGFGYVEQLANIQVSRRYPKNQRVDQIVGDLLNNYIKPYTRILKPSDVDITNDTGIDASSYVTQGPIHFECSILRALKFLAELQGSREFGIAADRTFYFREKQTAAEDALFQEKDLVSVLDAGQYYERTNKITVEGKQFGHSQTVATAQDVTDITNYGTFQRPVEVPWVEHQNDALRWAENIIAARKGSYLFKTVLWNEVDKRLERNHPDTGLSKLRIYGSDVSNSYDDLDITKIQYIKGYPEARQLVNDLAHPKPTPSNKTTLMRAIVTVGNHHFDLAEELEDKVISQIEAMKGRHRQFANPNVDVTNPNNSDYTLSPGQINAIYPPGVTDVTNSKVKLNYYDRQEWNDLVGMRYRDVTNFSGDFYGQELFVWDDVSQTRGHKYYWTGTTWVLMEGGSSAPAEEGGEAGPADETSVALNNTENNWSIGVTGTALIQVFRITSDASANEITGITGGVGGALILLLNVGSNDYILADRDSGSSAENQIITGLGADLTVAPDVGQWLEYDGTSLRWRCV